MINMFCIIKIKDKDIYLRRISSKYWVREYFEGNGNTNIEYYVDSDFVDRYITHVISRHTYYTHIQEYSLEKLEEARLKFILQYKKDRRNIKSFKLF